MSDMRKHEGEDEDVLFPDNGQNRPDGKLYVAYKHW